MPTLIWLQETESISYVPQDLPVPQWQIQLFNCPFCTESFNNVAQRNDHIAIVHPIERPVLFIRGETAPSTVDLRRPIAPHNISFANCNTMRISVDGASPLEMQPRDFANLVASHPYGYYKATLRNDRVTANYVLRVAIPEERELIIIEDLFLKFLRIDDVTVSDVRRFLEEAAALEWSRDYADALANYIFGILAKDQAGGTTIPLDQFSDKLQDSLEVLRDFERPIARSLTACIRLNLNDFGGPLFTSGNKVLDDGLWFFRERTLYPSLSAACGLETKKGRKWPCPIDSTSEVILGSCDSLSTGHFLDQERLNLLVNRGATTEQDRAKIRVMLAVECLSSGDREQAGKHLRLLTNDEVFGLWTNRRLKELGE